MWQYLTQPKVQFMKTPFRWLFSVLTVLAMSIAWAPAFAYQATGFVPFTDEAYSVIYVPSGTVTDVSENKIINSKQTSCNTVIAIPAVYRTPWFSVMYLPSETGQFVALDSSGFTVDVGVLTA